MSRGAKTITYFFHYELPNFTSGLAGATADVHCYDVLTNKWSRITPIAEPPTPSVAHVATAVGTMVVIQEVLVQLACLLKISMFWIRHSRSHDGIGGCWGTFQCGIRRLLGRFLVWNQEAVDALSSVASGAAEALSCVTSAATEALSCVTSGATVALFDVALEAFS